MWQFDRLTTSRLARCSAMRARVLRARRTRASFLFMATALSSFFRLESSGSAGDSRVTASVKNRFVLLTVALFFLRLLDHNPLADVANALALVRLGWTVGPNLGRDLPDLLLVDALDHDLRLQRRFDLHTLGHPVHHRMRKTQRQIEFVARGLGAISDADQRELLFVTVDHALDHICDQSAQGAVHRTYLSVDRLEHQRVAVLFNGDGGPELARQRSERTLDRDFARADIHFDLRRQLDRVIAYARHVLLSVTQRCTALRRRRRWRVPCDRSSRRARSRRWRFPVRSSPAGCRPCLCRCASPASTPARFSRSPAGPRSTSARSPAAAWPRRRRRRNLRCSLRP